MARVTGVRSARFGVADCVPIPVALALVENEAPLLELRASIAQ